MSQLGSNLQVVPAVTSLSYSTSKFGAMKNGIKKPYLILELLSGEHKELHPRKAAQLMTGKEVDGFRIVEKPADEVKDEQQVDKPVSKKAQAIAIYNEVHAANGARKDAMTRFKTELGMSDAGANTYYQNIKSGVWK